MIGFLSVTTINHTSCLFHRLISRILSRPAPIADFGREFGSSRSKSCLQKRCRKLCPATKCMGWKGFLHYSVASSPLTLASALPSPKPQQQTTARFTALGAKKMTLLLAAVRFLLQRREKGGNEIAAAFRVQLANDELTAQGYNRSIEGMNSPRLLAQHHKFNPAWTLASSGAWWEL